MLGVLEQVLRRNQHLEFAASIGLVQHSRSGRYLRQREVGSGRSHDQPNVRPIARHAPNKLKPVDRPWKLCIGDYDGDLGVLAKHGNCVRGGVCMERIEPRFAQNIRRDQTDKRLILND